MDAHGELYQRRALDVLPLLVRQAGAAQTVYYSQLAEEAGIPNARNLNYILGSIGTSLISLGKLWADEVPPIQALVINKADEMPGPGFMDSLANPAIIANVPKRIRKQIVAGLLASVYSYKKWEKVLSHYRLKAVKPLDLAKVVKSAPRLEGHGGGESEAHKKFKAWAAANPLALGIKGKVLETLTEYKLPTGDAVDILFKLQRRWIGVEVKSHISNDEDLARGVFQCIKYQALLEAFQKAEARTTDVATLLAVEAKIPDAIRLLANVTGVEALGELSSSHKS